MYQVEGYDFADKELAEKAAVEAEGIKYIKERTRMDDPDMVLKLYNQMIQEQMFETPVGLGFLYELQEYLHTIPYIKNEEVCPIPVKAAVSDKEAVSKKAQRSRRKSAKRDRLRSETDSRREADSQKQTDSQRQAGNGTSQKDSDGRGQLGRKKEVDTAAGKYRRLFHVSLFFTVVFAAIIVGMFSITYMSGNSVTILNYENAIIDKYESWENELNEREQELKKREQALKKSSETSGLQNSEEDGQDGTE